MDCKTGPRVGLNHLSVCGVSNIEPLKSPASCQEKSQGNEASHVDIAPIHCYEEVL